MTQKELEDLINYNINKSLDFNDECGFVSSVYSGIAIVVGLTNAGFKEVVEFCLDNENLQEKNQSKKSSTMVIKGLIMNLEYSSAQVLILGDYTKITNGMLVLRTHKELEIKVNESFLGSVLDGYGNVIISNKTISDMGESMLVDREAPGLMERKIIEKQLITGIFAIDCFLPIGLGSKILIIGNHGTGKSTIAYNIMYNNVDKNMIFIYVMIGQKTNNFMEIKEKLDKKGVNLITIIAKSGDVVAMRYIAPFIATAIAEYFAKKNMDVVMVFDDLKEHAIAYRELCLLMRISPAREAYPPDIFYLHARLLERSINREEGGSITMLPIISIENNNISEYIATNIISITDGQIVLDQDIFMKNQRPSVHIKTSVSRIGGQVQIPYFKKNCPSLKLTLNNYEQYEKISQLSSLSHSANLILEEGRFLHNILIQREPYKLWQQILLVYLVKHHKKFQNFQLDDFKKNSRNFSSQAKEIESLNFQKIEEILNTFCYDKKT